MSQARPLFIIDFIGAKPSCISRSVRNPNSAFYDYKIVDEGELFVESLHDRQKRQIEEGSNNTLLFVSVEGHENGTHFHLNTSVGNTIEIGECMMLQFKRTPMLKASHTNSLNSSLLY